MTPAEAQLFAWGQQDAKTAPPATEAQLRAFAPMARALKALMEQAVKGERDAAAGKDAA